MASGHQGCSKRFRRLCHACASGEHARFPLPRIGNAPRARPPSTRKHPRAGWERDKGQASPHSRHEHMVKSETGGISTRRRDAVIPLHISPDSPLRPRSPVASRDPKQTPSTGLFASVAAGEWCVANCPFSRLHGCHGTSRCQMVRNGGPGAAPRGATARREGRGAPSCSEGLRHAARYTRLSSVFTPANSARVVSTQHFLCLHYTTFLKVSESAQGEQGIILSHCS